MSVEVMAEKAANYIGEEYGDDDFESVCYGLKMLCYVSKNMNKKSELTDNNKITMMK